MTEREDDYSPGVISQVRITMRTILLAWVAYVSNALAGCLAAGICLAVFWPTAGCLAFLFRGMGLLSYAATLVLTLLAWHSAICLGGYVAACLGQTNGWKNALVVGLFAEIYLICVMRSLHFFDLAQLVFTIPAATAGGIVWKFTARTKNKQSADELEHTPSQHEVDTAAFGQTLEEKQHQEASRSPKLKQESKPFAMIDGGSGDTSSQRLGDETHQPALVPEEARKDAERKRKLKLSVGIAIGGAVAVMSLAAAALLFNAVRARIAQDRLAAAVRARIAQERLATAKAARREQPLVNVEVAGISKQPPMVNSVGMELKLLPAGKFMIGSASGNSDETPQEVTLTKPFYLGVHEVTQEHYEKVVADLEAHRWGDVVSVRGRR